MADRAQNMIPHGDAEHDSDVLTSIRRLIAQDSLLDNHQSATARLRHRAMTQAHSRAAVAAEAGFRADAALSRPARSPLVLTPQTRISVVPKAPGISSEAQPAVSQHSPPPPQQSEDDMTINANHLYNPDQSADVTALHPAPLPPEAAPAPAPAPAATSDAAAQDTTLPEEMNLFTAVQSDLPADPPLHGLIRDVVIREMEGELGSRMTRNLRQLIRAEIGRALQEATRPR